jgi:hypothetical protein
MKLRNLRALAVAAVGGFLLLATASNIYAVPTLSFSVDGGLPILCSTTGGGCTASTGAVSFSAFSPPLTSPQGGSFSVVAAGISQPILAASSLDLVNLSVTTLASGTHTLQIMFSDTGFMVTGSGAAVWVGSIAGPATSTVSASAYFSTSNSPFALTNLIGTSGPFTGSGLPGTGFSQSFSGTGPSTAPFSLTQVLSLTATGPGTTTYSGNFTLAVNPEPSSFVLMSSILLFAMGATRFKPRQS